MDHDEIDSLLAEINSATTYSWKYEIDFLSREEFIDYHNLMTIMCEDLKLIRRTFSNDRFFSLTALGHDVLESGGWLNYKKKEKEILDKLADKEQLELQLAQSNIISNERNEKNEKRNQTSTWINIGVGIINLILLGLQIFG